MSSNVKKYYASEDYVLDQLTQSDWKEEDESKLSFIKNKPSIDKDYVILSEESNSYEYVLKIKNGKLVSFCKTVNVSLTTLPNKLTYVNGDVFDPTGMVITAIAQDSSSRTINVNDYTWSPLYITEGTTEVVVTYEEANKVYNLYVPVNAVDFDESILVDFEYTKNADGTYTLTAWKETLNGEPSTEMVIPDNAMIEL